METFYIEHTEHRVYGASGIAKRYIREIQFFLWKYFDQVILQNAIFEHVKDEFAIFLKKLVGRHNPDFKLSQKYHKEISFMIKTPEGWCTFSNLTFSPISRVTSLGFLEKI